MKTEKGPINPIALTKWVKRLALPVCLVGLFVLFRCYWFVVVPVGMDTLPDLYPPGTTCIIQRDPSTVPVGSVVFLEVERGAAALLVRVKKVEEGRVHPEVLNKKSQFAGYARRSYPLANVRGLILSGVIPDPEAPRPVRNPPTRESGAPEQKEGK